MKVVKERRVLIIGIICFCVAGLAAQTKSGASAVDNPLRPYSDTAVYQGTMLKIDAFMPVYEAARSRGALQSYEAAVNVRLINKLYPTVEGGYAFGKAVQDSITQQVNGGFLRAGLDFNPLKKSVRLPHALLIGLRIGGSLQEKCDAWGEVAAGCQVQIVSGFYMGWTFRLKMLFTHRGASAEVAPIYIPGYGERKDLTWGLNYYLAWRF